MTNYEKILKVAEENGGCITTKQVVDLSIDRKFLTNLVKKGELFKISRGYYGTEYRFEDEYYKVIYRNRKAVYSWSTALYFHDLSDRTPLVYHITVPYGYNGSLKKNKYVILHYVKKELLELGVTTIKSPFGMNIRVYDRERTICDIIKHRKKMDAEIFCKALQEYAQCKGKDVYKEMKYARLLKVEDKVVDCMQILL